MNCTNLLKSLLVACAVWAILPAHATDTASTTDRLVVKYRASSAQRLDARSLNRALVVASRFRMSVQPVAAMADGMFVLRLDRCVSTEYATALASELASQDNQVEYAHVDTAAEDIALQPDTDSSCSSKHRTQYATAR